MNCKPGDMAIIINSRAGNEGKVVTCLKFLGVISLVEKSGMIVSDIGWEIDCKLKGSGGGYHNWIFDRQLRPIRPSNDQDEMLRIVGLPNKNKEEA